MSQTRQIEEYIRVYNDIMNGRIVKPRGLECKEVEDLQFYVDPDCPFMTFRHRKYDVEYFKKEMLWKLTADKYNKSIQEHASMWKEIINSDGTYNSQYGQYFFGTQYGVLDVVQELIRDPYSRKAVIPMMNNSHMGPGVKDTVCTMGIGFRIRDGQLNSSVVMRSSDAIWGLATDIPTFAFVYRLVKGLLSNCQNGIITITALSCHIYSRHYEMANKIINDPIYLHIHMPYCTASEAMQIIASRGNKEILQTAGPLGEWLCE